jgi:hypothetical protein
LSVCSSTPTDLVNDGGVSQGRCVTEVSALGHVTQKSSHDLAGPSLGKVGNDHDRLGSSRRANLGGDVLTHLLDELGGSVNSSSQDHVPNDRLTGDRVGGSHHRRFGHCRVINER